MVEREVTITFADLLAKPLVEHVVTLICVSNEVGGELIGNAVWLGLPIRELLAEAGPQAGADMVLSTSDDGWTAGTPLTALTDDRTRLLAIGMNGEPLPIEHGFPVRMVVPGLYGYVSATKWVTELKVTTFDEDQGYWTPPAGRRRVRSRPHPGSTCRAATRRPGGRGRRRGLGPAHRHRQGRGRHRRRLAGGGAGRRDRPDTWRQWRYALGRDRREPRSPSGPPTRRRAADADLAAPAPDGATGWHTITVNVS